jgi:hypothetical protein
MSRRATILWEIFLLLTLVAQMALRWELTPGEFGTMNTALGLVELLALPLLIIYLTGAYHLARPEGDRVAARGVAETVAMTWGGLCVILVLTAIPVLALPGAMLPLLTLVATLTVCGTLLAGALGGLEGRLPALGALAVGATAAGLIVAVVLGHFLHSASAGLTALTVAALVPIIPVLRGRAPEPWRWTAVRAFLRGDLIVPGAVIASLGIGGFLITNADRLTAQRWFGAPTETNFGLVDWTQFDDFHFAALLGRTLLAALLPLLVTMARRRYALGRTTWASLREFWIYLGLLLGGCVLLEMLRGPLNDFFGDGTNDLGRLISGIVVTLLPMGVLQGLVVFCLASRRVPECLTFGGAALIYAGMVFAAGRRPELMISYMFIGSLLTLSAVFVVAVVRYARNHP